MNSPIKAFHEFLELHKSRKQIDILNTNQEKYDELIRPFILNPAKYEEHIKLISEAKYGSYFANSLYKIFPKFLRNRMLSRMKWSEEYIVKLNKLKEELTKNVQPCEFDIDILPTRIMHTPIEWKKQDYTVHLLEIRISVNPEQNLIPESVDFNFVIKGNENLQIIESFPTTDFSETGEYQIGISEGGKFVSKTSGNIGGNAGGEISHKKSIPMIGELESKANLGLTAGFSKGIEEEKTENSSYSFKYTNKILKVISSAVGKKAMWKILRTNDNYPIGGITFFLSLLVNKEIRNLDYEANILTKLELFGEIPYNSSGVLSLSKDYSEETEHNNK